MTLQHISYIGDCAHCGMRVYGEGVVTYNPVQVWCKDHTPRKRDQGQDAFDAWFQSGIDNEWISQPTCWTHGGRELTPSEAQATEAGVDVCVITARIWPVTECC